MMFNPLSFGELGSTTDVDMSHNVNVSPYITEAVRRAKLPISVDTLVFRGRTYIQVVNLSDPADSSLTPNVSRSQTFYIDLRTRLEQAP